MQGQNVSPVGAMTIYEVVTCNTGVLGRFLDREDADRLCLEHNRKLLASIMASSPAGIYTYEYDPEKGEHVCTRAPKHRRYPTGRRERLLQQRAQVVARQVTVPETVTLWQVYEDRPCPSCEIGGWEVAAVFLDREKALEYAAGRSYMSVGPLQVSL